MNDKFNILEVTWASHEADLRLVREQVFVREQRVLPDMEWDQHDAAATHLLALDAQHNAIACARILHTGYVGRMAVLQAWRGCGLGRALLNKAVQLCQQRGYTQLKLSAQMHALGFYEKAGFVRRGEAYLDVNIWHVDMQRDI